MESYIFILVLGRRKTQIARRKSVRNDFKNRPANSRFGSLYFESSLILFLLANRCARWNRLHFVENVLGIVLRLHLLQSLEVLAVDIAYDRVTSWVPYQYLVRCKYFWVKYTHVLRS